MTSYWDSVAEGLYKITCSRYHVEYAHARLLIRMMTKIAELLHAFDTSDYNRESAELYFKSQDFLKHCEVLSLDDEVVYTILTSDPPRHRRSIRLPEDEA
jgi:hypothetical protein